MPEAVINENAVTTPEEIYYKQTLSSHHPQNYLKSHAKSTALETNPALILLSNHYNKATAFTRNEREILRLTGLLPPVVETMETQVKRAYNQLFRFTVPMSQHIYLTSLRERNQTLFYRLVVDHLEEVMPLIYTPTVGQACLEYGLQFRQAEGMYISKHEKGRIRQVLDNWKPNVYSEVAIIVVTDGSRILGLGDLGACGMGIPVGKLALYVAAAGFHPSTTLPILLDVGTDNTNLREDEFYLGLREPRLQDDQYYDLVEEFMAAVHDKWPHALLQFEDFSNNHCFSLLEKYRSRYLCFNDDIQGTGAVIAAGFINALKMAKLHPKHCKLLFVGAGSAGIGVANQIIKSLMRLYTMTEEECRNLFYLIDSKGLITADRPEKLQDFKIPFARKDIHHDDVYGKNLAELNRLLKPVALIGLSGVPKQFSRQVLEDLSSINERPIVFALSNPTSKAECTFQEAFDASNGRVIFASGSPFPPIEYKGVTYEPSQGNNLYTFPGLGFGSWLSRAKYVTDNMVTEATIALVNVTSETDLTQGRLYPSLKNIRETAAIVSAKVMEAAYKDGVSQLLKQPTDYLQFVKDNRYVPEYFKDILINESKTE